MKKSFPDHRTFATRITAMAFAVCGILSSGSASGALLANFEFTGNLNSTTSNPSQYTLTPVGNGIGFGSGATLNAGGYYRIGGDAGTGTTAATALQQSEYISFTLTPGAGLGVQLQNFQFAYEFVSGTTGTINIGYALFSSVNGFASAGNVVTGGLFTGTTPSSGNYASTPVDISLSSLGSITTATEFRLYIFDNSTTSGRAHRIDNLQLNGEVYTVPEPSSLLSVGLAGMMLASRRRRRA